MTLSREEVDASGRSEFESSHFNADGVNIASNTIMQLVADKPEWVEDWTYFRGEHTVTCAPENIKKISEWFRDTAEYKLLSDISPCDYLTSEHTHPARFSVSYIFTKLVQGAPRIRVQVWVNEGETIPSVMPIFPTADWHEREAYDYFGIEFTERVGLRRLLMPEDWVGHPLRKDYPLGGEPVTFTNSPREL